MWGSRSNLGNSILLINILTQFNFLDIPDLTLIEYQIISKEIYLKFLKQKF